MSQDAITARRRFLKLIMQVEGRPTGDDFYVRLQDVIDAIDWVVDGDLRGHRGPRVPSLSLAQAIEQERGEHERQIDQGADREAAGGEHQRVSLCGDRSPPGAPRGAGERG